MPWKTVVINSPIYKDSFLRDFLDEWVKQLDTSSKTFAVSKDGWSELLLSCTFPILQNLSTKHQPCCQFGKFHLRFIFHMFIRFICKINLSLENSSWHNTKRMNAHMRLEQSFHLLNNVVSEYNVILLLYKFYHLILYKMPWIIGKLFLA